jgi:carbon storage regulator CsrA
MPHLVLTRGVNQRVVIRTTEGAEIFVTFKGFVGRQARIDFEAPPAVKINREEVQRAIDAETQTNPHWTIKSVCKRITVCVSSLLSKKTSR